MFRAWRIKEEKKAATPTAAKEYCLGLTLLYYVSVEWNQELDRIIGKKCRFFLLVHCVYIEMLLRYTFWYGICCCILSFIPCTSTDMRYELNYREWNRHLQVKRSIMSSKYSPFIFPGLMYSYSHFHSYFSYYFAIKS